MAPSLRSFLLIIVASIVCTSSLADVWQIDAAVDNRCELRSKIMGGANKWARDKPCIGSLQVGDEKDAKLCGGKREITSTRKRKEIVAIQGQAEKKKRGRKRKRIKTKFKKWLGAFSKETDKGARVLTYYGLMLSGAVARSASATAVHPLNVIKTMLQTKGGKMPPLTWQVLSRGAGSQFLMSIPHGAMNFAVTESTKASMARFSDHNNLAEAVSPSILNPLLDFTASAIATFICSIVSTPQMVITDRIMTGRYGTLHLSSINQRIRQFC